MKTPTPSQPATPAHPLSAEVRAVLKQHKVDAKWVDKVCHALDEVVRTKNAHCTHCDALSACLDRVESEMRQLLALHEREEKLFREFFPYWGPTKDAAVVAASTRGRG
jgi:hypothetical protein